MTAQALEPDLYQVWFEPSATDAEIGQTLRAVVEATGRPVLVRFSTAPAVPA